MMYEHVPNKVVEKMKLPAYGTCSYMYMYVSVQSHIRPDIAVKSNRHNEIYTHQYFQPFHSQGLLIIGEYKGSGVSGLMCNSGKKYNIKERWSTKITLTSLSMDIHVPGKGLI